MPIHKDLPDSELHPPKGFIPAQNESFPIKNSSGLLEWISTSNLGSKWHTGSGIPAPALGRTGDFYLDSDVGDFYEKVNFNTWTLRGNVDGSDWFKGSGPPASTLGRVQDFYIDIDEGDIYEKTDPSTWDIITNIDGSDWFQGTGSPAPALGRVQDFYLDKSNGDLYEKTAPVTWTLFGNIAGPQGPPGPLANVVEDTSPELGGNLNGNGHNISNVGTYNGVTVETHASRHQPGGTDAIPTGTPVSVGATNNTGSANTLARSDHVHNIFPVLESQQASVDTAQTTTGGLTAGLTLTTAALAGGLYKIDWYYEWGFNDAGADYLGRIQVDNLTNILDHVQEPKSAGGVGPGGTSQRQPVGGFAIVNLTSGVHVIDLDFGSSNGALATLWRARLSIRRWG